MHALALEWRAALEAGRHDTVTFRAALESVAASERDAWVDLVFGLSAPPADENLPRGCVPYLPCAVGTLLDAVDAAEITAADAFVDVGSGLGRATTLVHLLTGATAIGLEVQASLAREAQRLAARLCLARVTTLELDASVLSSPPHGSVFFLYCPFSGERLARFFASIEALAGARSLRVCCVDMPAPPCTWLREVAAPAPNLRVYRAMKRA